MDKKTFLAVFLCLMVMIFYPKIIQKYYPEYYKPVKTPEIRDNTGISTQNNSASFQQVSSSSPKANQFTTSLKSYKKDSIPEKEIVLENDIYKLIFSNYGGSLKEISYKKMKNQPETVEVFGGVDNYWTPGTIARLGDVYDFCFVPFAVEESENKVIFSYEVEGQYRLIKEFILEEGNFLIGFNLYLQNLSQGLWEIADGYEVSCGTLFRLGEKSRMKYLGVDGLNGEGKLFNAQVDKVKADAKFDKYSQKNGDFRWVAVRNKSYALMLISKTLSEAMLIKKHKSLEGEDEASELPDGYRGGMKMPSFLLKPSEEVKHEFSLFAGPKYMSVLEKVGYRAENILNLGIFSFISKPMIKMLVWLYKFTNSYGLAIIVLTILIKIVLFPLTQKSVKSMNRMKELQPYLTDLKEKYKDNPKKMQTEMMGLYKKHGVNPLGGCLPMLLQLPIFFALFSTIRSFVELQGAPFLWVKDLSGPDTIGHIAGFPINPLPLVMGASMFWQQKMSTVDPQQQKMMMFMPVIFTVMLYNFSSGLVIYWLVNNILTIAQQYLSKEKMG